MSARPQGGRRGAPSAAAGASEEAIDPGQPLVDAHHHLWEREGSRYLFDELSADVASGHDVRATVYVEAGAMWRSGGPDHLRAVGETEFANGVAAMSASGGYGPARLCAAIVGFADLRSSRVDEVLDAHVAAGGGRFRGVRQRSYWDASEGIMRLFGMRPGRGLLLDQAFRRGFERLARRGLTFDAVLFHPQIAELADLARAFPDAGIVLDHLGLPLGVGPYAGRRAEVFAAWRAAMGDLARCPNVSVKIGGMGMGTWGFDTLAGAPSRFLAESWAPYARTCLDLFGASRCLCESNAPVDRVTADYVTGWNALKIIFRDCTAAERSGLFLGNARSVYRLDLPADGR